MDEEKKEEKADPMLDMMQRIRSGNVNLKKVAPTKETTETGGGVMAEMAKLLVRMYVVSIFLLWPSVLIQPHLKIPPPHTTICSPLLKNPETCTEGPWETLGDLQVSEGLEPQDLLHS